MKPDKSAPDNQTQKATMKSNNGLRRYVPSMMLFLLFEAVAVTLWLTKDNLFYLLNFSYIGSCLGLGTALFTAGKRYARHFVQLAVGSYMLLYLGVISRENMQIEGFWYYLFLGVFEAATIHYAVAKIFGPLLFGRGWCGYACWTAMVLDFLPYKQPQKPRKEKLGILRYVMFALSLALVSGLFLMKVAHLEQIMFWLFLAGNALYYIAGFVFAFLFKDMSNLRFFIEPLSDGLYFGTTDLLEPPLPPRYTLDESGSPFPRSCLARARGIWSLGTCRHARQSRPALRPLRTFPR